MKNNGINNENWDITKYIDKVDENGIRWNLMKNNY
jgi:hypothetical protein